MTTENTELQPIVREIYILLSLDTYQGMTDAEIESVIEYKISQALISNEHQNKIAAISYDTQQQIDTYARIENMSKDVLQSMLNNPIPWVTVSASGEVIQNV